MDSASKDATKKQEKAVQEKETEAKEQEQKEQEYEDSGADYTSEGSEGWSDEDGDEAASSEDSADDVDFGSFFPDRSKAPAVRAPTAPAALRAPARAPEPLKKKVEGVAESKKEAK